MAKKKRSSAGSDGTSNHAKDEWTCVSELGWELTRFEVGAHLVRNQFRDAFMEQKAEYKPDPKEYQQTISNLRDVLADVEAAATEQVDKLVRERFRTGANQFVEETIEEARQLPDLFVSEIDKLFNLRLEMMNLSESIDTEWPLRRGGSKRFKELTEAIEKRARLLEIFVDKRRQRQTKAADAIGNGKATKPSGKATKPGRPRLADSDDAKERLKVNLYVNIRAKKKEWGITGKELLKRLKADSSILELAKDAGKTVDENLIKAAMQDETRPRKPRTKSATSTK